MEPITHMNDIENKDWVIVCSQSLRHYVHCICGHRVKRITYLYHKPTKAIQYVGKTCVRKYGIEFSLTNPILLDVIKANLDKTEWDRDACVRKYIQSQYTTFMTMALTQESSDISVNTVVGPFRRLLSDVCDLVSEFNFDLVDVLRDIEREVESLNQTTRHQMVDEYSLCDTISEIASEHTDMTDEEVVDSVGSEDVSTVVDAIEDEPVSDIVDEPVVENPVVEDEPVYDIVEDPIIENQVVEDEPVSDIVDKPVVENQVVEDEPVVKNPVVEATEYISVFDAVEHTEYEPIVESIKYEPVLEVNEEVSVFDIVEATENEPVIVEDPVIVENPIVDNPIVKDPVVEDVTVDNIVGYVVEGVVKSLEESVTVDNIVGYVVEGVVKSLEESVTVYNIVGDVVEGVVKSLEESVIKKETVMERFLRTTSNINVGDTDLCSATTHCYCAMKYRIRLLHEGIEELRINVEKNRRETQELIQGSREQRRKTDEYIERSRKAHPELFANTPSHI